jgi:hypothetical protein
VVPLPRERAKAPYSAAEIAGFLALADARPTAGRRMRAAGLVCLGAGGGLIRADLRKVRGSGVIVQVTGRRPRVVSGPSRLPWLTARSGAVRRERPGHRRPRSRPPEPDEPADQRTGRGSGLPWLDTSRLRATWLADCAELLGLATFMRARDRLLAAARRPGRQAGTRRRGRRGAAARGGTPPMIPLAVPEPVIDASGAAPRIEAMLPAGVRARQLKVRTLLAGRCLAQADHRPAHLTRVHQALTSLSEDDQLRLGVITGWRNGPHALTYRQTERTFGLVTGALAKDDPTGSRPGRCRRSATTCSTPARCRSRPACARLCALGFALAT